MGKLLRVLIVEDSEDDALLLLRALRQGGYELDFERVETDESMRNALAKQTWDVILSDYSLPYFNAPAALAVLKDSGLDLPFIIMSGTVGEDAAIASLKAGAHDFIVKGSTTRLIPAIERELREADVRRKYRQAEEAVRQSEQHFRGLIENSSDAITQVTADGIIVFGSPAVTSILGYASNEWMGQNGFDLVHPDDLDAVHSLLTLALKSPVRGEFRLRHRNGSYCWIEAVCSNLTTGLSEQAIVINFRDITERKRTDEALRQQAERLKTLHKIDQAILTMQSSETIAEFTLGFIQEQVFALGASVTVFDFETNEAQLLAAYSQQERQLFNGTRFSIAGLPAELLAVLHEGNPYVIEDVITLPPASRILQAVQGPGLHSSVWIPLLSQGSLIGTLNLAAEVSQPLTHDQIAIACEMADQLAVAILQARYQEQIKRHTAELEQRVRERTAELQQALIQAQSADRAKTSMLATVSHEMRTPLSSIIGFSNLMLSRSLDEAKSRDYLSVINSEARRLADLINNFLDLQRLEAGKEVFRYGFVEMTELVRDIVGKFDLSEHSNCTLQLSLTPVPTIYADGNHIRQVIVNLVSNALKYSPEGGDIMIELGSTDGEVIFAIRDQGLGISPEEMELLFERFQRSNNAEQLRIKGTGLGLAICKEIIHAHHGRIWAESAGHNQGAAFFFALSLVQPDPYSLTNHI